MAEIPSHFPAHVSQNSIRSATSVVPLLKEFISAESVLDLGCKHGEWLLAFKAHGARVVLGLDQAKREARLVIDRTEFRAVDLTEPFDMDRRFDLAVCIEVAEHLPERAAKPLIASITAAAPVALFSAALPNQGGHGHLNERPRQYWHDLFAAHGYEPIDCLRPRIWQDEQVAWWYRQNLFVYAGRDGLERHAALRAEHARPRARDLELVHVDVFKRQSLLARLRESSRVALSGLRPVAGRR